MKKLILFIGAVWAFAGCTERWNDLVHTEVPASLIRFDVEGQLQSTFNGIEKSVTILLPYGTDPSSLTLSAIEYTESASCRPSLKAGDKIDLSTPLTLTLRTYDNYVWTIRANIKPKPQSDIYNMSFDLWSKGFFDSYDQPWAEDADSQEQSVWGMNYYMAMSGNPVVFAERSFLAQDGEGKAALKLQSQEPDIEDVDLFAAGMIYTGTITGFSVTSSSASLGVPFTKRPVSLDGYACYKPQGGDHGVIFVALVDWEGQQEFTPPSAVMKTESLSGLIGYGKLVYDTEMDAYAPFSIEITYLNENTPKYAVILATSSESEDLGTGVAGSVLYLDELGFSY